MITDKETYFCLTQEFYRNFYIDMFTIQLFCV